MLVLPFRFNINTDISLVCKLKSVVGKIEYDLLQSERVSFDDFGQVGRKS